MRRENNVDFDAFSLMAFKLLEDAQNTWRKIRGFEEIKNILKGVEYKNGIVVSNSGNQEATAA